MLIEKIFLKFQGAGKTLKIFFGRIQEAEKPLENILKKSKLKDIV